MPNRAEEKGLLGWGDWRHGMAWVSKELVVAGKEEADGGYAWKGFCCHPQEHDLHPGQWEAATGISGTSLTRWSKPGPFFKVTLFLCYLLGKFRSWPLRLSRLRRAEFVFLAGHRAACISVESQSLGSSWRARGWVLLPSLLQHSSKRR